MAVCTTRWVDAAPPDGDAQLDALRRPREESDILPASVLKGDKASKRRRFGTGEAIWVVCRILGE
ncbi:hypothetical protein GCM10023405_18480 [Streptomonospora salina]